MRTTKRPRHLEDEHQICLIKWARIRRLPQISGVIRGSTIADYLIHIPNGGSRNKAEAARFKRMGVKAGVSDLLLAIPTAANHGLWVELKAPYTSSKDKNYPSPEQREWVEKMNQAGYRAIVCWGWHEAQQQIEKYINEAAA
ncbi:VRR-NUC domain-containing protein [Shewanella avicenniae]|uniref:VRR-NUC domain-containing protein n=1 Tax=Shewanella avicenniae TaxID=2814294 RepID=A0ABX7QP30_9GAMM|nr:VRR-NUC domain-containing protein [Shewanella avicenniae]QSX32483.1 VRR-NUC domain-containing protein [Shewanella avicenniae]